MVTARRSSFTFGLPRIRRRSSVQFGSTNVGGAGVAPLFTPSDEAKALEQKKLDYEHKILLSAGAARLAKEQYSSTMTNSCCTLCQRRFGTLAEVKSALQRMEQTASAYQKAVTESKYLAKRSQCVSALAELTGRSIHEVTNSKKRGREWNDFELKKGKVLALREQKLQSVKVGSCLSCGFAIEDMRVFLSGVDHLALSMDNDLHVHSRNSKNPRIP
mmetsp:Transcript_8826/g.10105  ORF Transcript_8826/g.10105 Transcript_8826/m.10105 type:complete len:217 (-) Transcript_8826:132-782(-)